MDNSVVSPLVAWLNNLPGDFISAFTFFFCALLLLIVMRIAGYAGLCTANVLFMIVGNLQVLKISTFPWSPEPVALGTVVFAMGFVGSDIITEHYGKLSAQKSILLSFCAQVFLTIIMILTLGHAPEKNDSVHEAMSVLFTPSVRILAASLGAFVVSQLFDIMLFKKISDITRGRFLWMRTSVSTALSAFLDNIIFCVLAWVLLSPTPVSWDTLVFTYILGTYVARVVVGLLSTPLIYLSYWVKKDNKTLREQVL